MHRYTIFNLGIVLALIATSGCADSSPPIPEADRSPEFRLTSEPAGALEVLDAKDQAKDGQAIIVVGRVGGGVKPWIDGRAAFLLVDTRIQPSCQEGDHCEVGCPGCTKEMMEASTMVKFCGDDGKVMPVDARTLLGVKEQEIVVIKGVAKCDKAGNLSIAAKGVYVRR